MLAGVGCKDYDDDINSLNKDIEDLKGQIELKADKTAVAALQSKVDGMDLSGLATKAELGAYVKTDQLAAKLKELNYLTKSEIEALGFQKESDVKAIFNSMLTADAIMSQINQRVKDLAAAEFAKQKLTDAQKSEALAAIVAAIKADTDVAGIQAAIKKLLGDNFAEYMNSYISSGAFDKNVDKAAAKLLDDTNSDFAAKINKMIADGNGVGEENTAYLQKNKLSEVFAEYDKKLVNVWNAVKEVAGRIQSLVYVPTVAMLDQIVLSKPYVKDMNSDNIIFLTNTAKGVATFRVTPASLAVKLVEGYNASTRTVNMYLAEEEVDLGVMRSQKVEIINVTAGENGKINLELNSDYDFYGNEKLLAIALNIADVPSTEVSDDDIQDMEFSSAYVTAGPNFFGGNSENVTEEFFVAMEDEDGKLDIWDGNAQMLSFDDTKTISMLGHVKLAYWVEGATPDEGEVMDMATAAERFGWDNVPTLAWKNTAFTNFGTPANYTVTPADPTKAADQAKDVTVKIAAGKKGTVGQSCTLTTDFFIAVGDKQVPAIDADDFESSVIITEHTQATVKNADAAINWNYTEFADNNTFVTKTTAIQGLTLAQFKAIDWVNIDWSPISLEGTTIVADGGDLEISAAAGSNPSTETDAKFIEYTVKNYVNGGGKVKIMGMAPIGGNNQVLIIGEITVKGLPNMTFDITTANAKFVPNSSNALATITNDLLGELIKTLPADQKFFKDKADLKSFIGTLTPNYYAQAADATKNILKAQQQPINYAQIEGKDASTAEVLFEGVDLSKAESFVYTIPADKKSSLYLGPDVAKPTFEIVFTGAVTINKDNNAYKFVEQSGLKGTGNDRFLESTAAVVVTLKNPDKNDATATFKMEQIDLTNGYKAVVPSGVTAVVEYKMDALPKGWDDVTNGKPTQSGTNNEIIDWNGCGLEKIGVTYTMKVAGVVIDTKKIEVRVKKMINFDLWDAFDATQTLQAGPQGGDDKINLYAVMQAKAVDALGNKLIYVPGTKPQEKLLATQYVWTEATTYGLGVEFGTPEYSAESSRFSFNNVDGVFTVAGSSDDLAVDVTVTIPVTFTYKYAWTGTPNTADKTTFDFAKTKFTKSVTFKVLKSK